MKALAKAHKFAHVATIPLQIIVAHIPHPRKKKTVKVCIGIVIMLCGTTMAVNPVTWVPHFLWDAVAYTLHGYGALPMFKILCAKFDLENITDDAPERKEIAELRSEIGLLESELRKQNARNN